MKENKNGFLKNSMDDLRGNSQHRAWAILAIYFIAFIFIIMSIRSNVNKQEKLVKENYNYSLQKIVNSNYHFKYSVDLDGVQTIYEGDKTSTKEKFIKQNLGLSENYYMENNIYLKLNNGIWNNSNNPYEIITFKDPKITDQILKLSKYVSKTEYEDGNTAYTYQISTTTLSKLLDLEVIDIADTPNEIKITTDKSNEINKIEYDFTPYFIYKGFSTTNGNIVFEYTNFGKIRDLNKD